MYSIQSPGSSAFANKNPTKSDAFITLSNMTCTEFAGLRNLVRISTEQLPPYIQIEIQDYGPADRSTPPQYSAEFKPDTTGEAKNRVVVLPGGNTFGYVVRMLTETEVQVLCNKYTFETGNNLKTGTESFGDLYSWDLQKSGQNACVKIKDKQGNDTEKSVRWLWPLTFRPVAGQTSLDDIIHETGSNDQKLYPFVIVYKL